MDWETSAQAEVWEMTVSQGAVSTGCNALLSEVVVDAWKGES